METSTRVIEFITLLAKSSGKNLLWNFYTAFPNLRQSKTMRFAKRWTGTRDLVLIAYVPIPLINTLVVVVEIQPVKEGLDGGLVFTIH